MGIMDFRKTPDAGLPTRLSDASLNATFVPKWKPTTAYLAGDAVLNPSGDVVTAIANVTSGSSFNAANWNLSSSYAGKSATGYAGSAAIIQDATLVPSTVDTRKLVQPLRVPVKQSLDADLFAGQMRNQMQYTEDLSNSRYGATFTKTPADTIVRNGVTLSRVSASNFYHSISTNWGGNGMAPFVAGKRYLMSYYALGANSGENMFWMRDAGSSGHGHGKRLVQPNTLTRVWTLIQAASTTAAYAIDDPTLGFTSTTSGFNWAFMGNTDGGAMSMYVGGFQIEQAGDTDLDGIAGIGDSTMQGSSNSNDNSASREWMGYLEALLNARTFNRGIAGNKLTDMDARWATDITPLKPSCKYVIIQGGINDIGNGATLATVQGAVNSMTTKAKADGFIPVYLTCTPTQVMAANAGYEAIRVQFNDWLKSTFGNVIDIASVVADPYDAKFLRRTPGGSAGWYGDGTHYTQKAKRAIAEFVAAWSGWDLPTPTPYQKIVATTYTPVGGFIVVSPDGTKYRLTVANGGALTATAI
jgi:lysophospholipase L1-like esterase